MIWDDPPMASADRGVSDGADAGPARRIDSLSGSGRAEPPATDIVESAVLPIREPIPATTPVSTQDTAPARSGATNYTEREKVRIRFRKDGPLRFISHHDLMRCWDRLFRRANIAIKSSNGFNPRPVISSPLSLALGVIGEQEIIEVEPREELSNDNLLERLTAQTVEGLAIVEVSRHRANEATTVVEVEYSCRLANAEVAQRLRQQAQSLLSSSEVTVVRSHPKKPDRRYDIRPLILGIEVDGDELRFRCKVTPQGTVKPSELLQALDSPSLLDGGCVLRRTRIVLSSEANESEGVPLS